MYHVKQGIRCIRFRGDILRAEIDGRGWSAQDLADALADGYRLFVSRQAVWNWMTNRHIPRGDIVMAIAWTLGIDPEMLFAVDEEGET